MILNEKNQNVVQKLYSRYILILELLLTVQLVLHNPEPQRREEGQYHHPWISGRHLRTLLEMPQDLVFAKCIGMVVGVAWQIEQK